MQPPAWCQATITFPDQRTAEQAAIIHLSPILTEAETRELITAWFYIRKGSWRLRYHPAGATPDADQYLSDRLATLNRNGHLTAVVGGVYEPEVHAFGGPEAMDIAHRLWHHDSRHLLTITRHTRPDRPHELSIMLCAAMMRAAGLDRYEQGDVWARVASHRDPPRWPHVHTLLTPVERLLTVETADLTHDTAPLASARTWIAAYSDAGTALQRLHETGRLHRGLREILTHHVIFTWNRRSVPGPHQADLATAAKTIIFGPDPNTAIHLGSSTT